MSNRTALVSVFTCFMLASVFALHIPFFWDSAIVISKSGSYFFENHFSSVMLPAELDAGHAPLIAIYFALMWAAFGKTLLVSHLAILPFVLGVIWEFYKLAKKFLPGNLIKVSLLLLLLEPVFMTQTILMGYDIILAYFFIAAINCLHKPQRGRLLFMLSFLVLLNLRGIPFMAAVFLIHFFAFRTTAAIEFLKKNIVSYLVPILLLAAWFIYHYSESGWLLIAPVRAVQRQLNSVEMIIRQTIYVGWKLVDYGKIVFWIFVFISSVKLFKKDIKARQLLIILVMPVICLAFLMVPFSNPVGHKYFLPVYLLMVIVMTYHLQFLKSLAVRTVLIIVFCIVSIAGNFIMYPERFGNGWDTSLKVLPYFSLRNKLDSFVVENKIDSKEVAVSFPMFESRRNTHLQEDEFAYSDIDTKPLEKWNYLIVTNISNSYSDRMKADVRSKWKLLTEYRSGVVYMQLYQNTTF
jgi:hypothetical protein